MFASKSVKKVRKFISKFFNEVSTDIRDGDDDGGSEDVRVLSRSSIDDDEDVEDVNVDDHDDNKSDGSSYSDDNNEDNTMMIEKLMVSGKVNELVLFRWIQIIVLKVICKVWI